jgi:hypothetical protein
MTKSLVRGHRTVSTELNVTTFLLNTKLVLHHLGLRPLLLREEEMLMVYGS